MVSTKWLEKFAELKDTVKLEEHQKRIQNSSGSKLLYWGTGSGKSLGSIAATEGEKTDVVVPAALRTNYQKEVKQHTDQESPRKIHSYEAVTRKGLPGGENLVVDEVQRINNPAAARTKAILAAAPKYKRRLVLSGTPIRNHPSDIAPIIKTVDPESSIPLDQDAFSKQFIEEKTVNPGFFNRVFRGVKPGVVQQAKNMDQFREHIRGKVDYHAPDEKDYPSHTERIEHIPMSTEQADIYKTITHKASPALAWKVKRNMPLSKKELASLNSFMQGARAVSNTASGYGGKNISPKMQRMLSDIEEGAKNNPNFKSVAYSNYLESGANELSKHLTRKGITHGVFHGGLSDKEREKLVNNYNEGKIKSLLISGAGAEGIDLKGTRLMQIMEPHWNKARVDQARDRARRFKSHSHLPEKERHVDVVHYHSTMPQGRVSKFLGAKPETSADQYLHNLSEQKQKLNDQFLNVLKHEGQSYKTATAKGGHMKDLFEGFEKKAAYLLKPKPNIISSTVKSMVAATKAEAARDAAKAAGGVAKVENAVAHAPKPRDLPVGADGVRVWNKDAVAAEGAAKVPKWKQRMQG